jgi:hypothetical protein
VEAELPGFLIPKLMVIVAWLILSAIASLLIARKQMRILKARFGMWSPTRTVYFLGTMGNTGRAGEERVRNMDGPRVLLSDDDIVAFIAAQKKMSGSIFHLDDLKHDPSLVRYGARAVMLRTEIQSKETNNRSENGVTP